MRRYAHLDAPRGTVSEIHKRVRLVHFMPMAYTIIQTIKGRQYRYLQRSYRVGGKVRTKRVYLGPVDGYKRKKITLAMFLSNLAGGGMAIGAHFFRKALDETYQRPRGKEKVAPIPRSIDAEREHFYAQKMREHEAWLIDREVRKDELARGRAALLAAVTMPTAASAEPSPSEPDVPSEPFPDAPEGSTSGRS